MHSALAHETNKIKQEKYQNITVNSKDPVGISANSTHTISNVGNNTFPSLGPTSISSWPIAVGSRLNYTHENNHFPNTTYSDFVISTTQPPEITSSMSIECPTSYARNHSIALRTLTDFCEAQDAALGLIPEYHRYADRCLPHWCTSSVDDKAFAMPYPYTETEVGTDVWLPYSIITMIWTITKNPFWMYAFGQRDPPCCGQCYFRVLTVDFHYWPDEPTSVPLNTLNSEMLRQPTTIVDAAGFTFVSPSVYLGFQYLQATDRCGQVGSVVTHTTLAFDLDEVSTVGGWWNSLPQFYTTRCTGLSEYLGGGIQEDDFYSTVTRKMSLSDLTQNCHTLPGWSSPNPIDPAEALRLGDPCFPVIMVPEKVRMLQPEWRECITTGWIHLWDPPKTLGKAPQLLPTATPPSTTFTVRPSPGQRVSDIPTPTSDVIHPAEDQASNSQFPIVSHTVVTKTNFVENPLQSGHSGNHVDENLLTLRPSAIVPMQSLPNIKPPSSVVHSILLPNPISNAQSPQPSQTPIVITLAPALGPGSPAQVITLSPTFAFGFPLVVIGSQTLFPGHAITITGSVPGPPNSFTLPSPTQIFLEPQGTAIIIGGSLTIQLQSPRPTNQPLVLEWGNGPFTANSANEIVISGQTLRPGAFITVNGTQLYLDPHATQVIVGNEQRSTIMLTPAQTTSSPATLATINGVVYTIESNSRILVGDQTITVKPGQATVFGGTTTLLSNGQPTVRGGTTISMKPGIIVVNGSSLALTRGVSTGVVQAQASHTERLSLARVTSAVGSRGGAPSSADIAITSVKATSIKGKSDKIGVDLRLFGLLTGFCIGFLLWTM
ncbi:hypothetical protein B0J11DRAFT_618555 [Dendryphion nanum]|uniref:Uncharacterized protein n=1 Tax=Dendryphion nanum TaxID=256645 RepID=A0A9P9DCB0_9PLEO|nr:hypothetical protein B0J11DRAFT_618555 [Dendryphion nanum]